ncbi:MAG: MlaD family protein [Fibromonadales bacterium]|nr:MlaD family protein [Fibromonadales bacterium]
MNRNLLFYTIVFLCALSLVGVWFFFHPNSPWHLRYHYKVAFEEIGDLKVGDIVKVNGLSKGYVKSFELTDSCVWADIAVLAEVKFPIDSRMRVANAGLMGERIIEITLGNSNRYYAAGDHIMGFFDMGSTNIGNLALDILDKAGGMVDILAEVADTLFSDDKIKEYKKLGQKATHLGNKASRLVNSAENSIIASVDSLVMAKDRVAGIIDDMEANFDSLVKNMDEMEAKFANLEKSLEDVKSRVSSIAEKLESGSNTISLALDEKHNGELRIQMKKIAEDAEKLMERIKSRGLDLNVDIF